MSKADIQRIPDCLDHIQEAIGRIRRYTEGMKAKDFCSDEKTQDAVIRNLEIIGEAARNSKRHHPEFASRHAGVPWESAYEMRNALTHGYFNVDIEIVWRTIQTDPPGLEQRIKELRASL